MSRIIRSAFVAVAAGAVMLGGAATAVADDQPNCTAADLAGITGGVQTATAAYLFTHPAVNDFMTSLKSIPKPDRQQKIREYMDANPQTKDEMTAIRQPVIDFHNRCGVAD